MSVHFMLVVFILAHLVGVTYGIVETSGPCVVSSFMVVENIPEQDVISVSLDMEDAGLYATIDGSLKLVRLKADAYYKTTMYKYVGVVRSNRTFPMYYELDYPKWLNFTYVGARASSKQSICKFLNRVKVDSSRVLLPILMYDINGEVFGLIPHKDGWTDSYNRVSKVCRRNKLFKNARIEIDVPRLGVALEAELVRYWWS